MFFKAMATDYDGTLAADGKVAAATVAALERLKEAGRKLILVTGRELDDLQGVFDRLDLFDRIVAENGALLVRPETGDETLLAPPPPHSFVARLKERRVAPFSQGRVIVATRVPYDADVLATIRDLGLELQIIFNKGAVMVLPPGVNKASGLAAAAAELGLSPLNIVAVGDAENDHAFLRACGCGVAVANALEMLKEAADWVTPSARGEGVAELARRMLAGDLADLDLGARIALPLGRAATGHALALEWRGERLLLAGPEPERRAALVPLIEAMGAGGLQIVALDRSGAFAEARGMTQVSGNGEPPKVATVLGLVEEDATASFVVDLRGASREKAAAFAADLVPRLAGLLREKGRPHWLVLDRADELADEAWRPEGGCVYAAAAAQRLPREALAHIDVALLLDGTARGLGALAAARRMAVPAPPPVAPGEALFWRPASSAPPVALAPALLAESAAQRA